MKDRLSKLCSSMGIPQKELTREALDAYGMQKPDEDTLIQNMTELDRIMQGNVVVIGGFCACSKILGYRKMRRVSNDLDCIANEKGIQLLHEHFGDELFRTENYGDIFLDYNGIPVSFDMNETHGWAVPQNFFYDAKRFRFNGKGLTSISPEFLIALKARRSISKKRFYGKDAVDTANMLLAPVYKPGLKKVDLDKLGYLLRIHSSDSLDEVKKYLEFVDFHRSFLRKTEAPLFRDILAGLYRSVDGAYK